VRRFSGKAVELQSVFYKKIIYLRPSEYVTPQSFVPVAIRSSNIGALIY
jgi:hypothetical protein